jgi:hypothetical protein
MPELTKKQIEQHIENGGAFCVYCESYNLVQLCPYEVTPSGTIVKQVTCKDCGQTWKDVYDLVEVKLEDEEDGNG